MPSGLIGPVVFQITDPDPYVQHVVISVDKPVISKPEKAIVTMATLSQNANIHYTTDGTIPSEKSALYAKPFELSEYSFISAKAFEKGKQPSELSKFELEAFDPKVNGLNYEYFEGEWSKIPDFLTLKAIKKGTTVKLDPSKLKIREDHFGLKFQGSILIPTSGDYTFYLLSDDGSKLYIDGKLIVDNDGFHGDLEKSGNTQLAKGKHEIRIDYFDNINGESLKLFYGLNGSKIEIPQRWFTHE